MGHVDPKCACCFCGASTCTRLPACVRHVGSGQTPPLLPGFPGCRLYQCLYRSATRHLFYPVWTAVVHCGCGPTHRCVLPRRIPTPVCLEQGSDAADGVGRINLKTSTGISALVGEGSTGVTPATCFVAVGPLGGKPPFRTSTTHTILHICYHGDGPWEDVMQDSPASSVLAMWAPKPVKGWL